jgi:16S rRNA (adenine1518-N6/adenine1519-N6)-dimethyltransferase
VPLPSPKALLDRFGLRPKHSFGQNFLSDPQLAARIAALATGGRAVRLIELGAGLGALTEHLLASGSEVVAVERDRDLVPALAELFATELASGQLRLLEADAKAIDFEELLWPEEGSALGADVPRVLTGNLPYQITGPLLEKTVRSAARVARAVFLVQREVADRLAAQPGSKDYGALSVFAQARFEVRRALTIKAGAFHPAPRVESAVVVLTSRPDSIAETPVLRRVVKLAFGARRKTLRNAWRALAPAPLLERLAGEQGISLDARGETLTVEQFAALARALEATLPDAPLGDSDEEGLLDD